MQEEWQPQIVSFMCKWCAYAAADLAGFIRKKYSANMKTILVPCSGRVSSLLILKALHLGFDGVLVLGCKPCDCHHKVGSSLAQKRILRDNKFFEYIGINPRRVQSYSVSASEGKKLAEIINGIAKEIREIGPNQLFDKKADASTTETSIRS